jgi:uncharacterized membrane protein YsdA (DUF1294 family)
MQRLIGFKPTMKKNLELMMSSTHILQASKRKQARVVLYTELVFILLPVIFLALKNLSINLFFNPEWSLIASVLFGQAAARLLSGNVKHKIKKWELANFYIVICIAVSIVSVYLYSQIQDKPQGFSVYTVMQFVLFFLSLITHIVFGSIGQRLLEMPEK